jgi:hypothetical protein
MKKFFTFLEVVFGLAAVSAILTAGYECLRHVSYTPNDLFIIGIGGVIISSIFGKFAE